MSEVDVVRLPRAIAQLLSIIDSISEDSTSAAIDLALTIRAAADTLATDLNRYRAGRIPSTRELVVKHNYIVVYRVTERVEVLRVRHAPQQDR
ncbi:type II toxin-antitoxin system RelE/ParE family toxin [Caballeronia sp. KNU42]